MCVIKRDLDSYKIEKIKKSKHMYRCMLSLSYKECVTKLYAIAIIRVKIRVIYQFLF